MPGVTFHRLQPIVKGDARTVVIQVQDGDGNAMDLTGSSWTVQVRRDAASDVLYEPVVNVTNAATGVLSFILPAATTATFPDQVRAHVSGSQVGTLLDLVVAMSDDLNTSAAPSAGLTETVVVTWAGAVTSVVQSAISAVFATGGSITYVHDQAVASDTWVIPHNLGQLPAALWVEDTAGEQWEPGDVDHTTTTTTIRWSSPFSGTAYLK